MFVALGQGRWVNIVYVASIVVEPIHAATGQDSFVVKCHLSDGSTMASESHPSRQAAEEIVQVTLDRLQDKLR